MLVLQPSEKYKRHRPETILLYQLVKQYYLDFAAKLAEQGRYLTKYVKREYDEFLRYVDLNTVFFRVICVYNFAKNVYPRISWHASPKN